MIEYEELRADIDRYLMERFKYHKSLVCLMVDNIITTRRNSRVDWICVSGVLKAYFHLIA